MRAKIFGVVLLAICAALAAGAVQATPIPWKQSRKYQVMVEKKELPDFIRDFGSAYGVPVVVDPQVKGSVTAKFDLTPQSMLEYVASSYNLAWFYDGAVLYVMPANAVITEVLSVPQVESEKISRTLERLGILDARFPVVIDKSAGEARVTGPKQYVDLIRSALDNLSYRSSDLDEAEIRVFPLQYAYAADLHVGDGKSGAVPGVVSLLGRLFPADSPTQRRPPSARIDSGRRVEIPGTGGLTHVEVPIVQNQLNVAEESSRRVEAMLTGEYKRTTLPQFEADERQNAVIVRDLPRRFGRYETLIKSLDVRPIAVEIEARIIEVSSEAYQKIGLDLRFTGMHLDLQLGGSGLPITARRGSLAGGADVLDGSIAGTIGGLASGGLATTVLGNGGLQLLARIQALTTTGDASFVATPRILTLNNVEATLGETTRFFVRVAGRDDAKLFEVESGTTLKVRPTVVQEANQRLVRMVIQINDGSVSGTTVDAIPLVKKSSVGTWALIREGESLLIAGFSQKRDEASVSKVPGLSSLPIIGGLFQTRERIKSNTERLFMLTPRIVTF